MSQDTLNIRVNVDIPPNSNTNPTPSQLTFTVDKPTVHLSRADPSHDLVWALSGTYDDGETPYPTDCLRLTSVAGINWYAVNENLNPHLSPGQLQQANDWVADASHTPVVASDGQSASVTIERSGMTGILVTGKTLKLNFGIHVIVCAKDDADHPWVEVDDDPEVDIEMDA